MSIVINTDDDCGSTTWSPESFVSSDHFHIELETCTIRDWLHGDEPSLVRHANNRNVWINVRDSFPTPYTPADARAWVALASSRHRGQVWALVVGGFAIGGIALHPGDGVYRHSAEIGFWVGEEYWGRGIATEAVRTMTEWGFAERDLEHIHAYVFEWNEASQRVLEKAGYKIEGKLRRSAFKAGQFVDQVLFARLRGE